MKTEAPQLFRIEPFRSFLLFSSRKMDRSPGKWRFLPNINILVILATFILFQFSSLSFVNVADGFKLPAGSPEFADPIKNITVPGGSNIEFFCNVRYLGPNRIMWIRKEDEKEVLLGINNLLITKNPRISISLLPRSGEVSLSILYIHKVETEDNGIYHCIVSSSPMIMQVGTLEVLEKAQAVEIPEVLPSPVTSAPIVTSPATVALDPVEIETTESSTTSLAEIPGETTTLSPDVTLSPTKCSACEHNHNPANGSQIICIDVGQLWTNTRETTQYLLSWIYKPFDIIF